MLAIIAGALAIFFVLKSENALLAHPKGTIAQKELHVIQKSILLMLIVVVPTFICLFTVAWKYREKNAKVKYEPEASHGIFKELLLWIAPTSVIIVMSVFAYAVTHELDPHKPIESDVSPLSIQVVAMDWKWLFIYPAQGIATLNFVQFPERTPIRLALSADGSPMNSFWIPQLSGQIYCMTGMTTPLHIMADGPGVYDGRAAEINGKGLADMTFIAKSTTREEFESWVREVQQSPVQLTDSAYHALVGPSLNNPIVLYSHVEKDLFEKIVMKYEHPKTGETSCLAN